MITKLETECPTCGCSRIKHEHRENQHCNGDWNERRDFHCGRSTEYSPNYGRVRVRTECDQARGPRRQAREEAQKLVVETIQNLAARHPELGAEWYAKLERAVRDISCW